jgi:cell division protein FtsL
VSPGGPGWETEAGGSAVELAPNPGPGLPRSGDPEPGRPEYGSPEAQEQQNHLRLIRQQESRRANRRRLLVSLGIACVAALCLGLVALHVLIAENQFRLDQLQQTAATKQANYERLRLQVAQLEAPARIVSEAEGRLGMVQPGSVTYLPAVPTTTQTTAAGSSGASGPEPAAGASTAEAQSGGIPAPQGDADWPSVKPYLSGSP